MNSSQEPSYYEIALTNRQVLVFFVVLLLSVVGAFFSGVWLGQQRTDRVAVVAEEEPTLEEVAPPADEELAELNFFTDDPPPVSSTPRSGGASAAPERAVESADEPRRPARRETLAAAGDPETTLLEDVGGAASGGAATEPPVGGGATEASPAPPVGALPADAFVIQVFSSPDGGQARKLLDRLTSGGYEAFLSPVEVEGRTMHRVRIGPFAGKDEADDTAAEVAQAFRVETWVTRNE